MSTELYFIYDSHCPWSYAATPLVNALQQAYPKMQLHLLHAAHYIGKDSAGREQVEAVAKVSQQKFGQGHLKFANSPKNSINTANLMAWVQNKHANKQLELLNALQQAHFVEGNPLNKKEDFSAIVDAFKLSPNRKVFKGELSIDAEQLLDAIDEIQQVIGTTNFPVLVMTENDNAIFIDHSQYLSQPQAVVAAVKKELAAIK